MDTLLDDITTLDHNIIGRHYHRRDGIVTRHNNKNCKWINHPITPCDYNNVLADITETRSRIKGYMSNIIALEGPDQREWAKKG